MSETTSARGSSNTEGPRASLAQKLLELLGDLIDFFESIEVDAIPGPEFSLEVLEFLKGVKTEMNQEGERSYVARRSSSFLLESLSMALRRDRDPNEVPEEHAAIINTALERITQSRSGVVGSPDVQKLHEIEKDGMKFMRLAIEESGLTRKVLLP